MMGMRENDNVEMDRSNRGQTQGTVERDNKVEVNGTNSE